MARKQRERTFDIQEWFNLLDQYAAEEPFVLDREQMEAPQRVVFDDDLTEGGCDWWNRFTCGTCFRNDLGLCSTTREQGTSVD